MVAVQKFVTWSRKS